MPISNVGKAEVYVGDDFKDWREFLEALRKELDKTRCDGKVIKWRGNNAS